MYSDISITYNKEIPPRYRGPQFATRFSGVCNGTLGELIQAPYIHEGKMEIAIISLPIQRYSYAHFVSEKTSNLEEDFSTRAKCRDAMVLYCKHHGVALPVGRWTFSSELVRGRGMASSTADMVATFRCLDAIFERKTDAMTISNILQQIERSDSVFLDQYSLYLSGVQKSVRLLPGSPSFHIYYVDEGKTVDTQGVTASLLAHYTDNLDSYQKTLTAMLKAFDEQDLQMIARCATQSAVLGHDVAPKRSLSAMLENQERFGADGIVVAHTGSLIGFIFLKRPSPDQVGELSAFFKKIGFQCQYEKAQL